MYSKNFFLKRLEVRGKMRIAVAGLGIIGASIARALKANTEHTVDGWNRTHSVVEYALEQKYIDGEVADFTSYDVVFVAMPPKATMEFLDTQEFKDGAIVTDICGMKKPIEEVVYADWRNYRYVGSHPMAGKETSGIESSSETLFKGANIIFTQHRRTDEAAVNVLAKLYRKMGSGRFLICSAAYHDAKIAYTSQLAHIVSNAYVKSPSVEDCSGFTGGSFQDMTRVAGVDENAWTQLYFMNKDNLVKELEALIGNLNEYLDALKENDERRMKELLKSGADIRRKLRCYKDK